MGGHSLPRRSERSHRGSDQQAHARRRSWRRWRAVDQDPQHDPSATTFRVVVNPELADSHLTAPIPVQSNAPSPATRQPIGRDDRRGIRRLEKRHPAEPEVHVRQLRHRPVQPLRACRGGRGRRSPRQGLQPALHLRRLRAGQDAPASRHRRLRDEPVRRHPGPLRLERRVHERLHQLDREQPRLRFPGALSRCRHPPDRRHPVPAGTRRDPGSVLPHVQHAPRP